MCLDLDFWTGSIDIWSWTFIYCRIPSKVLDSSHCFKQVNCNRVHYYFWIVVFLYSFLFDPSPFFSFGCLTTWRLATLLLKRLLSRLIKPVKLVGRWAILNLRFGISRNYELQSLKWMKGSIKQKKQNYSTGQIPRISGATPRFYQRHSRCIFVKEEIRFVKFTTLNIFKAS